MKTIIVIFPTIEYSNTDKLITFVLIVEFRHHAICKFSPILYYISFVSLYIPLTEEPQNAIFIVR